MSTLVNPCKTIKAATNSKLRITKIHWTLSLSQQHNCFFLNKSPSRWQSEKKSFFITPTPTPWPESTHTTKLIISTIKSLIMLKTRDVNGSKVKQGQERSTHRHSSEKHHYLQAGLVQIGMASWVAGIRWLYGKPIWNISNRFYSTIPDVSEWHTIQRLNPHWKAPEW